MNSTLKYPPIVFVEARDHNGNLITTRQEKSTIIYDCPYVPRIGESVSFSTTTMPVISVTYMIKAKGLERLGQSVFELYNVPTYHDCFIRVECGFSK